MKTIYSTDDGTFGVKGLITDCLKDLIKKQKIDYVYSCGPELMMKKVFGICEENKISGEFSLERYMKCSFGVCGSCVLDPTGWRVCKEGPVFTSEELRKVTEFGLYDRDATGKKEPL